MKIEPDEKAQALEELLAEVESISNFLKQQVVSGRIGEVLYKKQVARLIDKLENYKEMKN